jgi:RimJ/RimL family protein N-acetyltransferase
MRPDPRPDLTVTVSKRVSPRAVDSDTPVIRGRSEAMRLTDYFRPALRAHFGSLGEEDLYLRFGTHCRPEVLDAYVNGIDFQRSVVLGIFDDDLDLVGVAHLSPEGREWELGLSVLERARNHGVGTELLRRSMHQVRLANCDRLTVHCLTDNHVLVRVVKRAGAVVVDHDGTSDGTILVPRLPLAGLKDLAQAQIAAFDFSMRAQRLLLRLIFAATVG